MYAVHLPHADELPERLRVKFFRDHVTFAAYLAIWDELNFVITWNITREMGHDTAYCNDAYTNPSSGRRYTRSIWVLLLDDDWYEVEDVVQFGGRSLENEWYRCDQWDGLLQLLKDKKIIK